MNMPCAEFIHDEQGNEIRIGATAMGTSWPSGNA